MTRGPAKIGQDAQGNYFCSQCGATRKKSGELFGKNEQSATAHLKHCRGVDGLKDGIAHVLGALDAPPPVPPRQILPAGSPQGTSRQTPGSIPASAVPGTTWSPYRGPVLAGPLPAADSSRIAELEAQLGAERDRRTLAEQETARMRGIAEEAVAYASNHVEHLGQVSQAQAPSSSPWPWIVGAGMAVVVAYWLFSGTSDQGEHKIGMGSSERPSSGLGKLADKVVNKIVDRGLSKAIGVVF
jgi:hypothetical protein